MNLEDYQLMKHKDKFEHRLMVKILELALDFQQQMLYNSQELLFILFYLIKESLFLNF